MEKSSKKIKINCKFYYSKKDGINVVEYQVLYVCFADGIICLYCFVPHFVFHLKFYIHIPCNVFAALFFIATLCSFHDYVVLGIG